MKRLSALLAAAALCMALCGCGNLDSAKIGSDAQATLAATQTAMQAAQAQLAQLNAQIAAQRSILATQPADAAAANTLAGLQADVQKITAWLAKAQPVVDGLQGNVAAAKAGQPPDFSYLGTLGPYGALAGILATIGWGAWQTYQKNQALSTSSQQAQTIAQQQPVIDHLTATAKVDNPVTAVAMLAGNLPAATSAPASAKS